jgi:hypothetical protein
VTNHRAGESGKRLLRNFDRTGREKLVVWRHGWRFRFNVHVEPGKCRKNFSSPRNPLKRWNA